MSDITRDDLRTVEVLPIYGERPEIIYHKVTDEEFKRLAREQGYTKAQQWWIEREDGERIAGPFTTKDDALRARTPWIEDHYKPETFWVREAEDE